MKLGAITSRAAEDPARRRSGLSEGKAGARGAGLDPGPTPRGWPKNVRSKRYLRRPKNIGG